MKILVTGGPVHAYLDDVKIITNKFRGGRMAEIADMLQKAGLDVTYLTAKGMNEPKNCRIMYHLGYEDYRKLVVEMAPALDGMLLGAAVVNLIPKNPWKGKFPSHQYMEGDTIPIYFQIAPRVINMVKEKNPKIHLFGFKLLSGVQHSELVSAAWDVAIGSKADAVFANDATNLDQKFAVTKEYSVIPMDTKEMVDFIQAAMADEYYKTVSVTPTFNINKHIEKARKLIGEYQNKFIPPKIMPLHYTFGTVAVRIPESPGSFVTTSRGKNELEDFTFVAGVNMETRTVYAGPKKATLNAPLLSRIFHANNDVSAIVHYHWEVAPDDLDISPEMNLPILPYALPGTVRDCNRQVKDIGSDFRIDHHGVYKLLRE